MLLTLSKRFEFATSRRLSQADLSPEENRRLYGPGSASENGFGGNFELFVIFAGPIDKKNGMIINVADIKREVNLVIAQGFDHKFLNHDNSAFSKKVPTLENIAVELLSDIKKRFEDHSAKPVACHLIESNEAEVTAYSDGLIERQYITTFSAARRTVSPNLSDEENRQLFGEATNIHGHSYRFITTVQDELDDKTGLLRSDQQTIEAMRKIREKMDHKYLNEDIPELRKQPITTECLTRYLYNQIPNASRAQLWENSWYGVEYSKAAGFKMMLKSIFRAAHRLHSPFLSEAENLDVYGKCNNLKGHGHDYKVELTLSGSLDERSGTMGDLMKALNQLETVLKKYDYKHLDIEIDDFRDKPSTGENILGMIYEKCLAIFGDDVPRLRLWETPNNRFSIRKESGE